MVGIQLYIETETIKRPFSPNWFKVCYDFALQFILLSVEKERHKNVADYLLRFLIRISSFHFWSFYKPKRSTPVPFIECKCFLFHLCYVVKCAESLLGHYTYNILTCSFNFHFPPTRDVISDQRSGSVGHQYHTFVKHSGFSLHHILRWNES